MVLDQHIQVLDQHIQTGVPGRPGVEIQLLFQVDQALMVLDQHSTSRSGSRSTRS